MKKLSKAILVWLLAGSASAFADAAKTNDLPRSEPEAQGIPSKAIQAFVEAAEAKIDAVHSVMVVRHGRVVAEGWWTPYGKNDPHVMYSLSKSFTSTAVGLAIAEGKLTLDDSVLAAFPEDAPATVSDNLKAMRLRDLLRMNTGQHADDVSAFRFDSDDTLTRVFLSLPVVHKPGTHFWYNTPATYMASAMVQKATGQTVLDYLRPRLFDPLGITGETWDASKQGITLGGFGLRIKTEDIARFGQLYLQKGEWQGKRLLLGRLDRRGDGPSDLERQQPDERLGAGLRLPVLALPPRPLPRRRRLRSVLHRDAGAGRRRGDHQRHARPGRGHEPGLGAHPARARREALPADKASATKLRQKLASLTLPPQAGEASRPLATQVSGKRYVFPANDAKLEALAVEFGRTGVVIVARQDGRESRVPVGRGSWRRAPACSRTASPRRSPAAAPGPRTTPSRRSSRPTRPRSSRRSPSSGRAKSWSSTPSTTSAFGERKRPRLVGKLESK